MSFKVEFNYEVGGRKVSQAEWVKSIGDEAQNAAFDEIKAQVGQMRCRTHGKAPKVVSSTTSGNRHEMKIEACCDEMLQRAQKVATGG